MLYVVNYHNTSIEFEIYNIIILYNDNNNNNYLWK